MKRFLWVAGLTLLCIFIILITVYRGVFYFFGGEPTLHMPSERKIEKLLSENYELYSNAANTLLTIDEDFLIRDTYDMEEIEAHGLSQHTDILAQIFKDNKINSVMKHNNSIFFDVWSSMDEFVYMVYCTYGEPQLGASEKEPFSPLSIQGWYYYRVIF